LYRKQTTNPQIEYMNIHLKKYGFTLFTALTAAIGFGLAAGCSTTVTNEHPEGSGSMGKLEGKVQVAGKPVAGATVTLYTAGSGAPAKLAEGKTDDQGAFHLDNIGAPDGGVLYVVAKAPNDVLALLSMLGPTAPNTIVVNELTTVASAFTSARFIKGEAISGNLLGLRIAAGNAPNLVDPVTGEWGKVLLDPLNSSMTTTMATLDTLGSLITYAATANDDWRARFFKAATPTGGATPKNTLEAMAGIAREPWAAPKELFGLYDEAYPLPAPDARRTGAPFAPYLVYVPDDFALSLAFSGGGDYANGRFMFDADGNLWCGQNWLPGSQSGVNKSTGGGVIKFTPNGTPLSPPITGFTGMGIDGIGWGTAVALDKVWITSFNGNILLMDFDGHPIAKESDFPMAGQMGQLMGIGIAANGDVWIADGSKNQLYHFPGGRVKDGKIVKVAGLKSPFDIVIDDQNRVWVANSQADFVARFPADDPSRVETFPVGISVRGLALDSKGNVWVGSSYARDFQMPKVPDGATIMEQFRIMGDALYALKTSTGVVDLIRPDGTQPAYDSNAGGFTGGGSVDSPWGLNIDGNDDVWVANIGAVKNGVVLMAGVDTRDHPAGTKAGDVIHLFRSGSIQLLTDTSIDPAGDVWAANNWNLPAAAMDIDPVRRTSTWGGGSGFTVIYGVASPVKPPRIGRVQPY
jgi:hypothetical protein